MGTGETLLTIGAIVLLGAIILTTNREISSSSQVMMQTSFGIDATSLGTSIIEKAEDCAFDEHSKDSTWVNALTGLTPPDSLGEDSPTDDTLPDDYDDFNGPQGQGFRLETDSLATGVYKVKTQVFYVQRNVSGQINVTTAGATWAKELYVRIWNTADTLDTVKMYDVFSYWY
jgi:hypothetical protein